MKAFYHIQILWQSVHTTLPEFLIVNMTLFTQVYMWIKMKTNLQLDLTVYGSFNTCDTIVLLVS